LVGCTDGVELGELFRTCGADIRCGKESVVLRSHERCVLPVFENIHSFVAMWPNLKLFCKHDEIKDAMNINNRHRDFIKTENEMNIKSS
jgi:hypothetical protein